MVLHTCQKQPFQVFRHAAVQNIFGSIDGKALLLVMTTSGNFTFNRILTVKTSLLCLLIQLISLRVKADNWKFHKNVSS